MPDSRSFRVSIKKFVDFACRSGDLVHAGPAGPTALEGQQAHKKLQQQKQPGEQSEVKVSAAVTVDNKTLKLSGRVDLLYLPASTDKSPTNSPHTDASLKQPAQRTNKPCVGEIKSCYAPPDKQPQSTIDLHWSQLKVYGYCVLVDLNQDGTKPQDNISRDSPSEHATIPSTEPSTVSSINLRLIWVNLQTDEITVDSRDFQFAELKLFVYDASKRYLDWMLRVSQRQSQLRQTAKDLQFPHGAFRVGQRKMAASVYVTTRDKKTLMCEAPTGIGKTISALFPAIKAMGEKHIETTVYLTAKNSGRESANSCLQQLKSAGLSLTAITITSKKTTCHCSNGSCERNDDGRCPLTIGFFDRLPQARAELLDQGIISPTEIDAMAHKHRICPFELSLQMLPWVSVIICDYNYVFDPLVRLTYFIENAGRQLLLIDEAHNLAERARSMYSAQLSRADIKAAAAECAAQPLMAKEFERVVRAMDRWVKSQEKTESHGTGSTDTATKTVIERAAMQVPDTISRAVDKCADSLSALTENNVALSEKTVDISKELYRYRVIAELFADHHRTITTIQSTRPTNGKIKNIRVQLRCLNATHSLSQSFRQFRSATAFSATLRPQQFSRDCLGLPQDTYCLALESPFPPENQGTFLCNWIDTRYRAREQAIEPLVELAAQVYGTKRGNYQIFFPSYFFMEKVYDAFRRRHPDIPTIIQQRDADESTRQDYLNSFESARAILAFSILGGIYGEGVDYTGDKLIGAIVIGTGLPSLSLEQKLIEQDYSRQGLNGFDYASRYPGMTRVLQTAGRVIRSETDTGVVILVDQRLTEPFYQALFPSHWHIDHCDSKELFQHSLSQFWSGQSTLFANRSANNTSATQEPRNSIR